LFFITSGCNVEGVKILIEISAEHYDSFVNRVPQRSVVYSLLKNGVRMIRSVGGVRSEVVALLCHEDQAVTLLQAARWFWPDASFDIQEGIKLSRSGSN
jgi:hypothetical protein